MYRRKKAGASPPSSASIVTANAHHIATVAPGSMAAVAKTAPKFIVKANNSRKSTSPFELSFATGDFFMVLSESQPPTLASSTYDRWFEVADPARNLKGFVPAEYFEIVNRTARPSSNHSTSTTNTASSAGSGVPIGAASKTISSAHSTTSSLSSSKSASVALASSSSSSASSASRSKAYSTGDGSASAADSNSGYERTSRNLNANDGTPMRGTSLEYTPTTTTGQHSGGGGGGSGAGDAPVTPKRTSSGSGARSSRPPSSRGDHATASAAASRSGTSGGGSRTSFDAVPEAGDDRGKSSTSNEAGRNGTRPSASASHTASLTSSLLAKVLYDFSPESPDELEANCGDVIYVLAFSRQLSWIVGKLKSKPELNPGLIPESYVKFFGAADSQEYPDSAAALKQHRIPELEEWKREQKIVLNSLKAENSTSEATATAAARKTSSSSITMVPSSQSSDGAYRNVENSGYSSDKDGRATTTESANSRNANNTAVKIPPLLQSSSASSSLSTEVKLPYTTGATSARQIPSMIKKRDSGEDQAANSQRRSSLSSRFVLLNAKRPSINEVKPSIGHGGAGSDTEAHGLPNKFGELALEDYHQDSKKEQPPEPKTLDKMCKSQRPIISKTEKPTPPPLQPQQAKSGAAKRESDQIMTSFSDFLPQESGMESGDEGNMQSARPEAKQEQKQAKSQSSRAQPSSIVIPGTGGGSSAPMGAGRTFPDQLTEQETEQEAEQEAEQEEMEDLAELEKYRETVMENQPETIKIKVVGDEGAFAVRCKPRELTLDVLVVIIADKMYGGDEAMVPQLLWRRSAEEYVEMESDWDLLDALESRSDKLVVYLAEHEVECDRYDDD